MLAVDTNVLVRYLRNDEPQAERARALIDGNVIFVSISVVLETEWVLRYFYEYPKDKVIGAIELLAGHPNICFEAPQKVRDAIDWVKQGLDCAAALHLAATTECDAFATFDKDLARIANRVRPGLVRLL